MHISPRTVIFVSTLVILAAVFQATAQAAGIKRAFERTLKVTGPVEVSVNTVSSDFKVVSGEAGSLRVKFFVSPQNDRGLVPGSFEDQFRFLESHPPFRQDGNRITLGDSTGVEVPKGISVDYELTVPAETRLSSQTRSGDFWIEGIRGPVTITTESGDIRMSSVRDNVKIRTSSGDIRLEQTESRGINIESSSGDVSMQLPVKAGFDLSAHTTSGSIDISPAFAGDAKLTENEAHLKVHGGGVPVEVRTVSGDIRIHPSARADHLAEN